MKKVILLALFAAPLFFNSCKDPEQTETEIIIDWIWDGMNDIYLWTDEIDQNLYPTDESNPENFFYSILSDKDRFSWIVDDYQALVNSFNNIELSSGISPYFIRITNSDEVIVVVEYVSKGSPSDSAGIKRGDIITDINNTTLNIDNYSTLFYQENLSFKFANYRDGTLYPNSREVSLVAKVIESNPIQHSEIINFEGKNIGYIAYTSFSAGTQDKWIDSLDAVFSDFKNAQVSDLILDIRYNPGGSVLVARHLASLVAPSTVPDGENTLVNFQWNEAWQDYFERTEGSQSENLVVPFENLPSNNLNLENVYILTTGHSASACELTIIGLEDYMNVVQIGEPTYGKFYGSVTLQDFESPPRHTWGMQPIVFKYASSTGVSDFVDGLIPDIALKDYILEAQPFGDINDPLIARAVEEISGVSPNRKKSLGISLDYISLPDQVREKKNRAVIQTPESLSR